MNRAPKKPKGIGQYYGPTGPQPASMSLVLFTDTSNHIGIYMPCMWTEIYEVVSTANLSNKPPPMVVGNDEEYSSEREVYDDGLVKLERSEIHKIVSRPTIFPITYIVYWVASHVDSWCFSIIVDNGKVLGSLTPKKIQNVYQLKPLEARCNKEYLDKFYMANPKTHLLVNPWYQEYKYFKDQTCIPKYTTVSFMPPRKYLTTMLFRHHGEADNTFFKDEWIPLAHGVMSTVIFFNWEGIVFANIIRDLEKAVPRPKAKGSNFYFSCFLLDTLCVSSQFPRLKWDWTLNIPQFTFIATSCGKRITTSKCTLLVNIFWPLPTK